MRMTMRYPWLITLCACNAVYGLEETYPRDAAVVEVVDTDGDGVLDVVDNCYVIPNPLQENADDDDFGDICDPCPTGSNHDEDGDLFLDGCDNCPQITNDDQLDADNDDLGDVCDPSSSIAHTRVRFDAFDTLAPDWIPGAVDWEVFEDSVRPVSPPAVNDLGLWNRRVATQGAGWIIETMFDLPPNGQRAGIETRTTIGGTEYACQLANDGGLYNLNGTFVTVTDNVVRVRLRANGASIRCELVGGAGVDVTPVGTRTNPGLKTTVRTRYYYIDIISTP